MLAARHGRRGHVSARPAALPLALATCGQTQGSSCCPRGGEFWAQLRKMFTSREQPPPVCRPLQRSAIFAGPH